MDLCRLQFNALEGRVENIIWFAFSLPSFCFLPYAVKILILLVPSMLIKYWVATVVNDGWDNFTSPI